MKKLTKQEEEKLQSLPIIPYKKRSEKEEKYLKEFINAEFVNLKDSGLSHEFLYGDRKNNKTFKFFHGGEYRVPRFIAKHVEGRHTPIKEWKSDGNGKMVKTAAGKDYRFQMRESFA